MYNASTVLGHTVQAASSSTEATDMTAQRTLATYVAVDIAPAHQAGLCADIDKGGGLPCTSQGAWKTASLQRSA